MAKKDKHVVYCGTYTRDSKEGIYIYDLDTSTSELSLRKAIPMNNSSYITLARDKKTLYSICDEGVESYHIEADGDLTKLNRSGIKGMRGCHLKTDHKDEFLFVSGYHDGKITVLSLNKDGSIKGISDGIFDRGIGTYANRNFIPHITSTEVTPDNQFICVVDNGIDQIRIYDFQKKKGKLSLVEIIRRPLESAPRSIRFSTDGRFCYILHEQSCSIAVYGYEYKDGAPVFTFLQEISTQILPKSTHSAFSAAFALRITDDGRYAFCTTAGDNVVSLFDIDAKTGHLKWINALPISGEHPKGLVLYPDGSSFIVANHDSNELRNFTVNYGEKRFTAKGRPAKITTPNCVVLLKLTE